MPTEGLHTTPVPEDIPVVRVTTRSGAVLDPRRPENKEQVPISMAVLAKEQLDDSVCQEARKHLNTMNQTRFYENGDGMLCRHGQQEGTQQVVVPRSLVADVLKREHSSPLGGHPGETKMYRTLRRRCYWPFARSRCVRLGRGLRHLRKEPVDGGPKLLPYEVVPGYGTPRGSSHRPPWSSPSNSRGI